MDNRNLSATYDAWSKTYDETPNPLIEIEEEVVQSLLQTIEFHDVLDAATGTGRYALYLAQQGKQVAAVDCNEKMLTEARKKADARQLPIEFRQEDISSLSFEDSSFDLVVCALTLSHIEDLTKPCQEFVRVLRPSGHLIISDLHPEIQAVFGPDFCSEHVEGEGPLFFPNYHSQVDDYLQAVNSAGAEIMAVRDISQLELRGKMFPGALLIWAKKLGKDGG
jgi:ubiquinone/menaquinone biosynthesis C-methylase UbiE